MTKQSLGICVWKVMSEHQLIIIGLLRFKLIGPIIEAGQLPGGVPIRLPDWEFDGRFCWNRYNVVKHTHIYTHTVEWQTIIYLQFTEENFSVNSDTAFTVGKG